MLAKGTKNTSIVSRKAVGKLERTKELNDAINETLSKSIDGQRYLCHLRMHSREIYQLADEVRKLVSQSGMSVSEARGFFDFMKIIIDKHSSVNP